MSTLHLCLIASLLFSITLISISELDKDNIQPPPISYALLIVIFVAMPIAIKISSSPIVKANILENISLESRGNLEIYEKIQLSATPNIYLISFDAMITEDIAKRYLDLDHLKYEKILQEDFITHPISISPRVPTLSSLNSLMGLDQKGFSLSPEYFAGRLPSPITAIAKSNGYTITTGYSSNFFGPKGGYIDEYVISSINPLSKTILCLSETKGLVYSIRIFGACKYIGKYSGPKHLSTKLSSGNDLHTRDWPNQVLDTIRELSKRASPQLGVFYIYRPNGHTPGSYNHTNLEMREAYKAYFSEGAENLGGILEDIKELISENDPNAIVIIFGDHGAWLSRGVDKNQDPSFYYTDRHRVAAGVLKSNNPCASKQALYYSKEYTTPSRLFSGVVRCLSSNKGVLDKALKFDDPEAVIKYTLTLPLKFRL